MKKILLATCLCGVILANSSCDNFDDIFPQEYEKILLLKTSGEQALTLYKTGEKSKYQITVMKTGSNPALEANAHFGAMPDADFQEYISERGLNYLAIPANCYSCDMNELQYSSDETYKIVTLTLDPERIDDLIKNTSEDKTYVLPLVLTSETDSILANTNTLMLKPEVVTPTLSFKGTTTAGTITKYVNREGGTISIPLGLQIDNQWDFSCKVDVDETTTTLYNFEIVNKTVEFTAGNNGSVQIKISQMENISGIIGLKITEIIGKDGFDIDNTPLQVLLSLNKYPLTESMLSSNAQEPSEGSLANLLDGDIGTYFHSAWSISVEGDHYVQITLPEALNNKMSFTYTNRQNNGNAALAFFDLYVGENENSLELYKNFTWDADGLPGGGAGVYKSPEFNLSSPVKVLRFVSKGNWTGGVFFVWSEFSLYGF